MASLTMASHAAVKSILVYFIGALGLVLLLSASWNTSYRFSNFELRKPSGASSDVSFPYASQSSTRRGNYEMEGTLSLGRFSPRSYRIVPKGFVYLCPGGGFHQPTLQKMTFRLKLDEFQRLLISKARVDQCASR